MFQRPYLRSLIFKFPLKQHTFKQSLFLLACPLRFYGIEPLGLQHYFPLRYSMLRLHPHSNTFLSLSDKHPVYFFNLTFSISLKDIPVQLAI